MLRHPSDWKYFMDLFYCCCHLRLFVTNEIITPGSGWGKHYMTSSAVRLWKGLSFLVFDTVDHKHHLWHSGWNLIICSFANGNSWKSETRLAVNLRHKGVFVFSLVHSGEIWSWQIFAWGGSDESAALPSLIRCTDRRTVCVCVCGRIKTATNWQQLLPRTHFHTASQILHWFGNVTWIHWEVICIYRSLSLHRPPFFFCQLAWKINKLSFESWPIFSQRLVWVCLFIWKSWSGFVVLEPNKWIVHFVLEL